MRYKEPRLNKALREACSRMPALRHWPDQSKPFDIADSEVARWLAAQPDVLQAIYQKANELKLIQFDADTRTWRGKAHG